MIIGMEMIVVMNKRNMTNITNPIIDKPKSKEMKTKNDYFLGPIVCNDRVKALVFDSSITIKEAEKIKAGERQEKKTRSTSSL